ncbi:unnamed protein product [Absidia cylindrospora]
MLQASRSTEQPQKSLLNVANNKTLMHGISQGALKPTIPRQHVTTKQLHRSTSSPPTLVMPRPRYAEPPTRAILRSYDLEKTQVDPDTAKQQLPTPLSQTQNTPLPEYIEDDKLHMTSMAPLSNQQAAISIKPRKVSPITALPPQYDVDPIPTIRNEKSLDGSDPHESMTSMTGSDDSNRIYDTALESPAISTSTLMDYPTLTSMTTGIDTRQSQSQRHPSPISFSNTHGVTSSLPLPHPPTTSSYSVTVAPLGQTSQHQHTGGRHQPSNDWLNNTDITKATHATPSTKSGNDHDLLNHTTRQMHDPGYIESLQEQVMFMQQQRIMDRVEYERMEQVHKERTNWMQAEIDRTQTKLLALSALKQQHDDNLSPSINDPYDDDWQQQQQPPAFYEQQFSDLGEIPDSPKFRSNLRSSTTSSTSSASLLKKSRSGDSIPRLSRSSSKTSISGRSSSGGLSYRAKQHRIQSPPPPPPPPLHQRHILAPMDDDFGSLTLDEQQLPPPPLNFWATNEHPTQTNRRRSGSLSRRNSQLSLQQGGRQTMYSPKLRGVPRSRRSRSKSIDMQPPSPIDDPYDYYDTQSSILRPRSGDTLCRRQRSYSVEQPPPFFYHDDDLYFQQPDFIDCDLDKDDFPSRKRMQHPSSIPPMSCYGTHRTFRPPPSQLPVPLPSPYYYPPSAWHMQQQQQQILSNMLTSTDDTIYWKYASGLADVGQPLPPFNLQANIPPMWMDDVPRPPPFWRGPPSSSSEYAL